MHLLEDGFDKGLWNDSSFILFAIFPVYVGITNLCHHTHMNPFCGTYS